MSATSEPASTPEDPRESAHAQVGEYRSNTLASTTMAWFVHGLTASGVLVGVAGIYAVFHDQPGWAIFWLLVAQLIDGIDGPIARRIRISHLLPQIDGYVMDLIVDYLTCVIVPAIFLHGFALLPSSVSIPAMGLVLFTSALWFSRTDMMTEDHWFRGFPATWNVVAPTFLLLRTPVWFNFVAVVVLCALQLTNVEVPHAVQVTARRAIALPATVAWLLVMAYAATHPYTVSLPERICLILGPCVWAGLTIHRHLTTKSRERVAPAPAHP